MSDVTELRLGTPFRQTDPLPREPAPTLSSLPLIDISPLRGTDPEARAAVARQIADAATGIGFFYLTGHGIAQERLDAVQDATIRFFEQPISHKMAVHMARSRNFRGYVPVDSDSYEASRRQQLEAITLGLELEPGDPDLDTHPLHGPNPWPALMPDFREPVLDYWQAMIEVSDLLMRGFAMALRLPETVFHPRFKKPLSQLRLIRYPAQPRGDEKIGTSPHCDSGAFTVLLQDDAGGLEIYARRQQGWCAVTPVKGAFVINIGDTMKLWTNGRFTSTPHRVINRSGRARRSIAYFANCDFDEMLAPLPEFAGPEPVQAKPYGQSMLEFFRRNWGDAARDPETAAP